LPPEVVAARIETRYHRQLDEGFLDEVRRLVARPGGVSRTAGQALGYKELAAHVAGEVTLDEAVDQAVRRTRQFARRQRAWFRRDPRIEWLEAESDPFEVWPALEQIVSGAAP
jgi:tRNA dimethylallyltransferase